MPIANEDIILKEPLVVTSADELGPLIGLIHDEYFDLDDVSFFKDRGLVTIPYRRIFHGHTGRMIRNWLICRTYEVDVIRSVLTIRNVEEYTFDDRSHIGTYSFNTVSHDKVALLIKCCEDLDFRMVVSKIEIESRDLEIRGKARITRGLLWLSTISKVYD
jgi:hypothetical protein